ncbi:endo-alpha-N-acetylgalactosaminidase family protein [Niabella drilacis]|uniref:Endo-alpha-N-acetylgalactosaminidase n=1 Tax=Niabella drilacis (strain DSM 25811 / CCM 8410 / CCUG 62505 / LMG 26954 / E90) TaxID=1285928 RepID=A0A1G7A978_NIADE|nr:endo-alpha-N-acetylgalactosaminidase family protein [Niabella drilacis]SDE10446.1 endo-alpha-N-acetylgalactosaminidase [Niabella drilacis]
MAKGRQVFLLIGLLAGILVLNNRGMAQDKMPLQQKLAGQAVRSSAGETLKAAKGEDVLFIIEGLEEPAGRLMAEFDVVPENSGSKFGLITGYNSPGQWNYIGCNQTADILGYAHWFAKSGKEQKEIAVDIGKFFAGYSRHVMIQQEGRVVTVYLDGEKIARQEVPFLHEHKGKLGFRVFDGGAVLVKNFKLGPVAPAARSLNRASGMRLGSGFMDVLFSQSYPVPFQYRLKATGAQVSGARTIPNGFLVNGRFYTAHTRVSKKAGQVIYTSVIPDLKTDITTAFSVQDNVVLMKVLQISERGTEKVKTLAFPYQDVVTLKNDEPGATLSVARNVIKDLFLPLAEREPGPAEDYGAVAILNNNRFAVSIENNVPYNGKQVAFRTFEDNGERFTAVYSNEWIIRDVSGARLPLPEMKIVFAGDLNRDEKTDWQDAAIAHAKVFPAPRGAAQLRQSYATITMNFASGAQYPFLRQLDNIKKFYLATDGFGQMVELKGYQSEGHDSGHPDYAGHYNERAGGLKELQLLTKRAKDYGAYIGLHINHSEAYPEARAYDNDIISDLPGWSWLDQAYLINKKRDIERGSFAQRIRELRRDLPDLAFLYLDTYREHSSIAKYTAGLLSGLDLAIWTEDQDVFYKEASWTHHPSDAKSMISRFIQHRYRDGYARHPLLLGGYDRGASIGFMGWQKGRDFNKVLQLFFTQQLPYRFLMQHPLLKLSDTEAVFEGALVSSSAGGVNYIKRDGHLVKSGDLVFIPWFYNGVEKIYHYNPDGGRSSWQLPREWRGTAKVRLYKLTDQGRIFLANLPVSRSGEVVIDAGPKQGYVIYKSEPTPLKSVTWGEYGLVKNPGFDNRLEGWSRKGGAVQAVTTAYGQTVARLEGNGSLSQPVALKKGKDYVLSVWVEVSGRGKASLTIGSRTVSINESTVQNFTDNSDRYGTRFQCLKIPFRYEGGAALVQLGFEPGTADANASFDDVRLIGHPLTGKPGYLVYEDFEQVDEGWGPFIASKPSAYTTHLSETHAPYTDDTIDGRFSLKTWREGNGEVMRTSPALIRFEAGKKYRVSLKYKVSAPSVYRLELKSKKAGKTLQSIPLDERNVKETALDFENADADDTYLCVTKKGDGILILDDFGITGY